MKVVECQIPESSREKFIEFANKFGVDPYKDPSYYMKVMEGKLEEVFPSEVLETLKEMGKSGDPSVILIKGMPIDREVPDADTVAERSDKKTKVSEKAAFGVASLMGYKLESNPKEQGGKPIHNIAPVKGLENTTSSKGRDPFYLHTENPFEQSPPEFLMLIGLEADSSTKTTYFFLEGFIESFPEEIVEAMKKPEFEIRSGAGFDEIEKGNFSLITQEESGRLRLRLYQVMERIRPLTSEAEVALNYISERFSQVEADGEINGISIQRGEALIFNNGWGLDKIRGVMHGRGGYIENPNRWLQRGFLKRQDEQDIDNIAEGYYRAVSDVINDKRFNPREASSLLRKVMVESQDVKKFLEENPSASVDKATAYSYSEKSKTSKDQSWLKRITKESADASRNNSR
jgi:L-asparagine oxygenase